ncbi:MAG TPA: PTPA-CTERM sorting domain-containing protein [Trichocoleus sp.]
MKTIGAAVVGAAAIGLSVGSLSPANALTFDLKWSGQPLGNKAEATGFIDFDPTQIGNPGGSYNLVVDDFSITITGANKGNGTFTLSDFDSFGFFTPPNSPLDFTKELVGQPANSPSLPFGTPNTFGEAGDFNIFSPFANPNTPNGFLYFQFVTAAGDNPLGNNDKLTLTSFAPQSAAPVPTPALLPGLIGMGVAALRKRKNDRSEVAETVEV